MKKGMYIKIAGLFLLCILLVAGCGKEDGGGTEKISTAGGGTTGDSGNTGNSGEHGGTTPSGTAAVLWVNSAENIPFESLEEGYQVGASSCGALGNRIYLIRMEYPENGGAAQLCVQIYDIDKREAEKTVFVPEIPGHEDEIIVSVDLTVKQELSLKLASAEAENDYALVKMDLQGTVLEVEETFPSADDYPYNQDYLSMTQVFPLADGNVFLRRWDNESQVSVITLLNEETGEKKSLGTLEEEVPQAVCSDGAGILYYYSSNGCIVRWDVEKDVREELTEPLYRDGIEMKEAAGLTRNEQGELLLCILGQSESKLYVLSGEKMASEGEIQLVCVQDPVGNEYLRKMAAVFSRDGGEASIVLEGQYETDYTDYRNRVFAEILAGKGPELMLVSYEDMEILQEKGLLCDLSDMLSEDVLKNLLPGVKELGTANGQFTGITPEVAFRTMITSNVTWEGDSWTVLQFTELLKGRENWEWPVSFYGNKMSYYTMFWTIFCNDLNHSPFIDTEAGKCFFDSQEFMDILRLCQKYGQPSSEQKSSEERKRMVREGECLAAISSMFIGFRDFSDVMLSYGEDCHIVGFPGEAGSSSYITNYSQGYLVVNINAEHKEEIKDFLNYLLDYENQYEVTGTSVRLDVIRDSIIEREDFDGKNKVWQKTAADPYASVMEIPQKPDGTSFKEEYLEFIQNCTPEPVRIPNLAEIIGEELQSCFEGGKSVEDTAAGIQNRVQLYLDERAR